MNSHFIIASLAMLFVAVSAQNDKPKFCGSYACPFFVSKDFEGYEFRTYVGTHYWASTSGSGSLAMGPMFMRLFGYINDNDIAMTVPVTTRIDENSSRRTMSFYLTSSSPPGPTNPGITVRPVTNAEFYVKSFDTMWWAMDANYENAANELRTAIGDSSLYEPDVYYQVGYTSPRFRFRRYYEVWIKKL